MIRLIRMLLLGIVLALGCSACSVAHYNPKFFDGVDVTAAEKLPGKALIITTTDDDEYVFTGRPSGIVGAATMVRLGLGDIAQHAAENAFNAQFSDGTTFSHSVDNPAAFSLIVQPHIAKFSYSYITNLLSNTPRVDVSVLVKVLRPDNSILWQKLYEPGNFAGTPYPANAPWLITDHVSAAAHKALLQIMVYAARDIRAEVLTPKGAAAIH